MYEFLKKLVIRVLHVPPEPEPPAGSANSLKEFRAAPGYYSYRFYSWLIGRLFFGLFVFGGAASLLILATAGAGTEEAPTPVLLLLVAASALIVGFYVLQSMLSYTTMRLDYEMRWYKVTDTSLRIREGVWFVREKTMTFANIQNISLSQGPLQRYFKISDLMVRTAGGGGGTPEQQGVEQIHMGYFRGVDNAEAIREMMLDRLRNYKDTGLGDHDDEVQQTTETNNQNLQQALLELSREAQALGNAARKFTAS